MISKEHTGLGSRKKTIAKTPAARARHQSILDAAYEGFTTDGLGVSVEKISKRAGVAKQTIYNTYENKLDLLSASAIHKAKSISDVVDQNRGLPVRNVLIKVAEAFCATALKTESMNLLSELIEQRKKVLPATKNIFKKGADEIIHQLSAYLDDATKNGKLGVKNPALSAEFFFGALKGYVRERYWLKDEAPPNEKEINERIEYLVDLFMLAHRPG